MPPSQRQANHSKADAGEHSLALLRQQRPLEVMHEQQLPVLLIRDGINVLCARGAQNMSVFNKRTPARYLLLFAQGPCILFDYFACAHLSADLPTIARMLEGEDLDHISSGGGTAGSSQRMALALAALVRQPLFALACAQLELNAALLLCGRSFENIEAKAWPIPVAYRQSRCHAIGHLLGMRGDDPNIPRARPGEPYPLQGVLEPGKGVCIESHIDRAEHGQGAKLDNRYLITDTGPPLMSGFEVGTRLEMAGVR